MFVMTKMLKILFGMLNGDSFDLFNLGVLPSRIDRELITFASFVSQACLTIEGSLGFIGGRPNHAHYFIGFNGKFYLTAVPKSVLFFLTAYCHCKSFYFLWRNFSLVYSPSPYDICVRFIFFILSHFHMSISYQFVEMAMNLMFI